MEGMVAGIIAGVAIVVGLSLRLAWDLVFGDEEDLL